MKETTANRNARVGQRLAEANKASQKIRIRQQLKAYGIASGLVVLSVIIGSLVATLAIGGWPF